MKENEKDQLVYKSSTSLDFCCHLVGPATGAIAGTLFAPGKGSKTRKRIKSKGDDYTNELKSKFDEFRDSLVGKFESTKRDAENLAKKGKAKYNDVKKDVKNTAVN